MEFTSFLDFLPDSVKEWYSPEDDDFLRETIRQRKIRERQEHEELQFDIPDSLLLEAIESFERPAPAKRRFAVPKTDDEVELAKTTAVPKKTRQDTEYCTRLFLAWRESRSIETGLIVPTLEELQSQPAELASWMERFVLEVRKKDGSAFQSSSLNHVVAGIMRYLRSNGQPELDFYKDAVFHDFRRTLDSEMKRLKGAGENSKRKQAEPITEEEEERLWETGQLGDHSPQALVDTVFFYNGLYFVLRSAEHRDLRRNPCQIQLIEKEGRMPYLKYTEDVSKNRQGGLKSKRVSAKVVLHHANTQNPSRCFMRLFSLYLSHCPEGSPPEHFYQQPLVKPTSKVWYSKQAIGHNKLQSVVQRICTAAGITGYKTNHSLRATAATRLFHHNVDGQLIMERTGHRSTDGIRSYKRTSEEQQEEISEILNNPSRNSPLRPVELDICSSSSAAQLSSRSVVMNSMEPNTCSSGSTAQLSSLPVVLNSCSNIIINMKQ